MWPSNIRSKQTSLLGWAALSLTLTAACTGQVDPVLPEPGEGSPSSDHPDTPEGGKDGKTDSTETDTTPVACADALLPARAVLVTPRQYVNTLRDLLGEKAVSETDANAETKLEFDTVDRARMTTATLDRVLRLAEAAAESLRGKTSSVLGCNNLDDAACVRTGLTKLSARAFKRPAEPAELDALLEVYAAARTLSEPGEGATLLAVQALLAAPSTLYRTEFRTASREQERPLTPHERAAQLGALLLDSLPDAELLSAADRDELTTPADLDRQIERLLALPRVRDHVTRLLLTAFNVPRVFEAAKEASLFPEFTPALQTSMYEESRRFVDDVLWSGKRPVTDLLTSQRTFVDPALAKIYGVTYPGSGRDFVPVDLPPERSGLLTQASVLTVLSRTEKTSVVARGLYVRGALLCMPKISSPPASIQAEITAQLEQDATERELAAYRAKTSPCMSCHAGFDRLGLLLEGFDAVGRRTKEGDVPLDLSGLGSFSGSVESPRALALDVVDDGQFTRCLAQRVYAYGLTTASEAKSQKCIADALQKEFEASDGSLRSLVSAIVHQPDFFRRTTLEM